MLLQKKYKYIFKCKNTFFLYVILNVNVSVLLF